MAPPRIRLDWPAITAELGQEGYAVLPRLLDDAEARALVPQLLAARPSRAHGAPGLFNPADDGQDRAWALPRCPLVLNAWCATLYAAVLPLAQRWAVALGSDQRYPTEPSPDGLHATASCLGAGDEQTLQHGSTDTPCFPLQLVMLLSEPGVDFTGGEFVMTEQRPRLQSRPIVVPLRRGDAALVTVAHRPVKGLHGDHRVTMKQAISRVRSGERVGLSLQFPAAP